MTQTILLKGCSPTPLAHYLKALGILRLVVAEQKDPDATGCWQNEGFVLNSSLDEEALLRFFLEEYQPTPILTPWNGRGGFLEGEDDEVGNGKEEGTGRKGAQMVSLYSENVHPRFGSIKSTLMQIASNKTLSSLNSSRAKWKVLDKKKKSKQPLSDEEAFELKTLEIQIKATKRDLLQSLRNSVTGPMLEWFDACQIVSDRLLHAPLLGAGGLDGSMDFGVNYLERLSQLFDVTTGEPASPTEMLLKQSLFDATSPHLTKKAAIGQFYPGGSGGANATTGFESNPLINPWDFIFIFEGALLFAAGATKRYQQSSNGKLSYSFTVNPRFINPSATLSDEEPTKQGGKRNAAEMWLPLWNKPASLSELRVLFQEGRATVGARPARDGLDFARAVASLGVDRGITEFQRYALVMRAGKTFLATPFGRFKTQQTLATDLIHDLDQSAFLEKLRYLARDSKKSSGYITALVRQLESRLFDLAQCNDSQVVQDILILLGRVQRALSLSSKGQGAVNKPVPLLKADWLKSSDDGSVEFRLACALASVWAKDLPMRFHFAGINTDKKSRFYNEIWDKESHLAVWGEGSFESNITTLLRARLLAAERLQHQDKPFNFGFGADCSDIACFLDSSTDDRRIGDLAQGLALLKDILKNSAGRKDQQTVLPGAYVALKPFFTTDKVLQKIDFLPPDCKLPFRAEILAWLAAGQTDKAVKLAWDKLKQAGVALPAYPNQPPSALGVDGQRLLAALAIPIEFNQLKKMLLGIKRQQK